MPIYGRLIMAALGMLLIWKILNALRTGIVSSRGFTFKVNEQPMIFSLGLTIYSLCVLFCGWLAVGNNSDSFWHLVAAR